MNGQQSGHDNISEPTSCGVERFLKGTFDNLPAPSKVLIGLFAALNSASTVTSGFELPDYLWETVRLDNGAPLINQSEDANWLRGVTDGILLMVDHM